MGGERPKAREKESIRHPRDKGTNYMASKDM